MLAAMVVFPGLTPTRALGVLGLASVAIGLAFKEIFENFYAGLLILWRFPFGNGDYIKNGDVLGQIEEITVGNTMMRRTTGELIVVPNSKLSTEPVVVLTNCEARRATLVCGIAYDADLAEAVGVIRQAVDTCESLAEGHEVQVLPRAFGSSSLDVEIAWWAGALSVEQRRSRAEVVESVKSALDSAGIEIPFPQRALWFKDLLGMAGGGEPGAAEHGTHQAQPADAPVA